MPEDECSHEIEVNLHENEVVRHCGILIIRGKIKNKIKSCDRDCGLEQVFVYNGKEFCASEFCENGEFKLVLEVSESEVGNIELLFKYCTAERRLRLYLEKPSSVYRLQPIYILCSNETESDLSKAHCDKIDVNIRLLQALYADRIREAIGGSLTTFVVNGSCHVFRSDITREEVWSSDEHFLWSYFAEELLRRQHFGDGINVKLKIVAFIGCTKYDGTAITSGDLSYGNIRKHLRGHASLGGGDLALFGSCFFYAWPSRVDQIINCLQNTREVDHAVEPDESNYRQTYLGVYATTLGAVCHELGHIFDLAHTQDGIMGTGFDYLNRLLTITNRTENLPKRIVGDVPKTAHKISHCRLTQIKRDPNRFLDNYREQKKNDCFFFTRNCAVILANNKWFKNLSSLQVEAAEVNITFNAAEGVVTCDCQALKIIEIRVKSNSLVEKYFEFSQKPNDKETFTFHLARNDLKLLENTHFLYVQTLGGESKRFDFPKSNNKT